MHIICYYAVIPNAQSTVIAYDNNILGVVILSVNQQLICLWIWMYWYFKRTQTNSTFLRLPYYKIVSYVIFSFWWWIYWFYGIDVCFNFWFLLKILFVIYEKKMVWSLTLRVVSGHWWKIGFSWYFVNQKFPSTIAGTLLNHR